MNWLALALGLALFTGSAWPQSASIAAFGRLKALAGTWEADSPAGELKFAAAP